MKKFVFVTICLAMLGELNFYHGASAMSGRPGELTPSAGERRQTSDFHPWTLLAVF